MVASVGAASSRFMRPHQLMCPLQKNDMASPSIVPRAGLATQFVPP